MFFLKKKKEETKNRNLTKDGFRKFETISSADIVNWKKENPKKYNEFIRAGGGLSGLYDISDEKTRKFVNQYKEYIHKSEIYYRK